MRLSIRIIFFLVLIIAFNTGIAQTCTTIAMPDSVYACNNDTVSILAQYTVPTGLTVIDSNWTPATGINVTNFYNPIFSPGTTSQTYTLNIYSLTPTEYVQDGNFDSLNTNSQYFSSTYRDTSGAGSLWPEGYYSIQNNPMNVHPNFASFGDHTTGTGNMMVINGDSSNSDIWCQTILVAPGTYYDFSAWAASCTNTNTAILQFKINGVLVDSPLHLTDTNGLWREFHALWYSDTSTVITICINDQQTALSGNDFAIDDVSFKLVCQSTASVYVGVPNLNDSIELVKPPCQDGLVNFSIFNKDSVYSSTAQYSWSFGDNTTAAGGLTQQHTYGSQNFYMVSLNVTNHSCADSFFSIIYVDNFTPRLPISKDTSICAGQSARLWVAGGNSYVWTPSAGLSDTSAQMPLASPTDTTTYTVVVNFGDNCISHDTVTVSVMPLPVITATPTDGVYTCMHPVLQLHVSGALTYVWYPAAYVSDPLAVNPYATPDETTMYIVTGTDTNKCTNTDSITVTVPDISKAFVPSAFTPNGDGDNDRLHPIPYCGFRIAEFTVFNRWGEKVFYSNQAESAGWDGNYNGSPAPMDTYFYQMVGTTKDGVQKMLKGTAVLIR